MKVKIYQEFCIGCGLCEELVPEVFRLKGDMSELKCDEIPDNLIQRVKFAIEDCPGKAIAEKRDLPEGSLNQSGYAEPLR